MKPCLFYYFKYILLNTFVVVEIFFVKLYACRLLLTKKQKINKNYFFFVCVLKELRNLYFKQSFIPLNIF